MNRAAIYVRVSTDTDAQKDSPANQIATCREYAETVDLEVSDSLTYNDAGISGMEMENRPEVQRMLADARAGKFDAILFTAISRFSRDLSDTFGTKKRLERTYGIRLISIEEGYDSAVEGRNSEMVFTVHAMLAAHKSQEMSKSIRRGLRQSAKRGRHIGNVTPFGYVKTIDKKLIPDPKSASTVQDIFSMYLNGMGSKTIAETLNARGMPTASTLRSIRDTLWQASTINVILHNEVYIGTIIAHKRTAIQDLEYSRRTDTNVKRLQIRDEDEWVVITNAHEPIIDQETFDRAQKMMEIKTRNKGIKRNTNLLAGLMVCASCGGKMIVTGCGPRKSGNIYKYVVCSKTRRISKSACDNHSITKYGDLLEAILEPLQQIAKSDHVAKDITHSLTLSAMNGHASLQDRVNAVYAELDNNEEEQKRNLEAYRTGIFPKHIIEDGQRGLVAKAEKLRSEIVRLQKEEQDQEGMKKRLSEIESALNIFKNMTLHDDLTQRMALQSVLDKIIIDKEGNIEVNWAWSN